MPAVAPCTDGLARRGGGYCALPLRPDTAIRPNQHVALRILTEARQVVCQGVPTEFTRLEFDLLCFYVCARAGLHRRSTLMAEVWGMPDDGHSRGGSRTVDVHIRRIRGKLGPDLPLIKTVRGVGYRVDDVRGVVIEDHQG